MNIARIREEDGLSQTELALRCDKDRQNISRLEKGSLNPFAYFLHEIAKELKVPVKNLLDFD
jgi:transcriptional regulator with XRE-family HTH domain